MPWDVYGHDWAVRLLRHELASGRLAHAYLFTGADGIGKRTLALELARAAACTAPPAPGESCGACRACRMIPAMAHPDLHVLMPEGKSGKIPVDSARALTSSLSLKPLELNHRFALLLDFHRAQTEAANALLKTLEEPPSSALLLLTAETADEVLPTIASRCRLIALRPAPEDAVLAALRDRAGLTGEPARTAAHLAGGRIGWALRLSGDDERMAARRESFEAWRALFRQTRSERFRAAQSMAADRAATLDTLRQWQSFAHDLQLMRACPEIPATNVDFLTALQELAQGIPPDAAQRWFAALRRAEEGIDRNANARLALETAFLDAPALG